MAMSDCSPIFQIHCGACDDEYDCQNDKYDCQHEGDRCDLHVL